MGYARATAAALIPWLVLVAAWELASARSWMSTTLFPPSSSFIGYAIDSDFRVGFGKEGMTIPVAILASAWRVVTGLFIGFVAAIVTGILVSISKLASAAVLPQVFTMLRLNFFAAWMAVLAAEMVGLKNGVGMIVILGREMFNPNLIMLGICIIGVTGYAVDALLLSVQRRVLWWRPE